MMSQRISRGRLARLRIEQLADGGRFHETNAEAVSGTPLQFEE